MQRCRADQVGSLLRPPVLLQARADHAAGKLSADELRQREDEAILEALEMQCQVGIDVLSDGFEPLRFIPHGKTAVLGLVTTKRPQLESQEDLRRAIDKAVQYLPLDDLALSPQCGFASVAAGNLLSPDEQRRKLELVVDTARKVWG